MSKRAETDPKTIARYKSEAEEIADLLSEIGRTFKARLGNSHTGRAKALSTPQRDVLVRIGRRPHSTPANVSERTGRDPAQVTRIVAELETLGLVVRTRSDEDRRSVILNLTEKGGELFGRMLRRRTELSKDMLSTTTAAEKANLKRLLQNVLGALKLPPKRS